jgi:energy-coupling factor transport system permease protein
MIRDITIGQYYPTDSVIHRLDPRVKLIGTFFFIVSLFLFQSLYGYIVVTLFLASVIKLSRVPFGYIVRGLKAIVILLLFTTFFNLFFSQGEVIFRLGFIKITDKGLRDAIFFGIRLTLLIIGSSLMTFTTTPNQLTDGLEKIMKPLNHIKVPVHEIAMMMSIALRFIPILLEETDKIMKAQMARGADFESGGILKRAKSLIPLLVPLFVSAFRRANDLAMAMEARCYRGGEGRTKMKPLRYKSRDGIAYLLLLVYISSTIAVGLIDRIGII